MTSPVSEIRLAIAAAITSVPAYGAPPDDVSHIPCAVVGPVSIDPMDALATYEALEFPVMVIGRRYDSLDVHTQLDDAMWNVRRDLKRAAATTMPGQLRVGRTVPNLVTVGGHEQPAYEITVTAQTMNCE